MPWTPKAKRFLLSKASPLKPAQKEKMLTELHQNPVMGHAQPGYSKGASPLKALMRAK